MFPLTVEQSVKWTGVSSYCRAECEMDSSALTVVQSVKWTGVSSYCRAECEMECEMDWCFLLL